MIDTAEATNMEATLKRRSRTLLALVRSGRPVEIYSSLVGEGAQIALPAIRPGCQTLRGGQPRDRT